MLQVRESLYIQIGASKENHYTILGTGLILTIEERKKLLSL